MKILLLCNTTDHIYKTELNLLEIGPYKSSYIVELKDIEACYQINRELKWFRIVMMPNYADAATIKNIKMNFNLSLSEKFRQKIFLGERYNLFDPETIKKFDLGKYISSLYVSIICENKRIDTLEYLHKNNLLTNDRNLCSLDITSYFDIYIDVLEWWKKSGLSLIYSEKILDSASEYGYINVLKWWFNSGLPLKYSDNAIDGASQMGHIDVLELWKNSELELKYSSWALDGASANSHIDVLEWWKNSGLELKYSFLTTNLASDNGHINVLNWWHDSKLKFRYNYGILYNLLQSDTNDTNDEIIEWWKQSRYMIVYPQ
uniref:Ankyrin repeat protein n=1 Tax=viral metagenome TaxID=1070528 RepID=A0A6C0E8N2_9ZZZZ